MFRSPRTWLAMAAALFLVLATCLRVADPWRRGGVELVFGVAADGLPVEERAPLAREAAAVLTARLRAGAPRDTQVSVSPEGDIRVRVPGTPDVERLTRLVTAPGRFDFVPLATPGETRGVFAALDRGCARASGRHACAPGEFVSDTGQVREEHWPLLAAVLHAPLPEYVGPLGPNVLRSPTDTMGARPAPPHSLQLYVPLEGESVGRDAIARVTPAAGVERSQPGAWGVIARLTPVGRRRLERLTRRYADRPLAMVMDRVVLWAPPAGLPLESGQVPVAESLARPDAEAIAAILGSGTLPVPLRLQSETPIPASR